MKCCSLLTALALIAGCRGDAAVSRWTTVADSTGDTIRVAITGPMPASSVHRLVAELRVGAEDGAEEETFGSIDDVIGTDDGGLLVWDAQAKAIRRFDAEGGFVRLLGGNGGGPGEHGHVNGIVRLTAGGWALWDANGSRINRYREDGTFVDAIRSPVSGWYLTDGLRSDPAGRLYIWSALTRDSTTGNVTTAGYLAIDGAGAVVDTVPIPMWGPEPDALSAQSPDGGSMMNLGRPWTAANQAEMLPDGGIVGGIGREYVFYILPRNGKPTRVEREYDPVPVSETERKEREAQITERLQRVNPNWTWNGAPLPATKPPYRDFSVGGDGRIWVRLSGPAEEIPDAERVPVNPQFPNAVRLSTRELDIYDVYDGDGTLLGRVAVPARTRLLRMRGNEAWGVQLDSLASTTRSGSGSNQASGQRTRLAPHRVRAQERGNVVAATICDPHLSGGGPPIDCSGVDFASAPFRRRVLT